MLPQHGVDTVVHRFVLLLHTVLPFLTRGSLATVIPSVIETIHSRPESTFLCLEVPRSRVHVIAKSPIVIEPVSNLSIDCTHCLHVGLPPLSPQVFRLHLQQF